MILAEDDTEKWRDIKRKIEGKEPDPERGDFR